jgi:hypothetical protein
MRGICAELRATVLCPSRRRRGAAYSLLCSSVNGSWLALQVHTIVRDAPDFDNPSRSYPVQEKVTSATAMSRTVQNAEAPHDLVSGLGSSDIGTVGKLADRLNKRVAIATGLPRVEILSRSFENICEIELCRSAEPNTPFPLGHDALLSFARNDFLGKFVQISLQQCGGADLLTSRKALSASAWLWFHLLSPRSSAGWWRGSACPPCRRSCGWSSRWRPGRRSSPRAPASARCGGARPGPARGTRLCGNGRRAHQAPAERGSTWRRSLITAGLLSGPPDD